MEKTYVIQGESYESTLKNMENYLSQEGESNIHLRGDELHVGPFDEPQTAFLLPAVNGLAVTVEEGSNLDKMIGEYAFSQES